MAQTTDSNAALKGEEFSVPTKDGKPDVLALMAQIRAKVKADVQTARDSAPRFKVEEANFNSAQRKAGELVNSEELRFLNAQHSFALQSNPAALASHRPGIVGKLLSTVKRKLAGLIRNHLLRDYFAQEHEFHACLVRYLNDLSKYIDARDASNFWELIRKIDVDITRALERIERIGDEQSATSLSAEARVYKALNDPRQGLQIMREQLEQNSASLKSLENLVSGLESIIAKVSTRTQLTQGVNSDVGQKSNGANSDAVIDYGYLLFENRFRGSQEEIFERLEIYPAIFKSAKEPVLEIGAGRGELQELFKRENIPSLGIDLDSGMVQVCREKNLDVTKADALTYLKAQKAASLGGVIAIQVVEHLTPAELSELISLCAEKVAKGGRIVFETINPASLYALSSAYFRDPTHKAPLHPDTLAFMLKAQGLRVLELRALSEIPLEAKLKPIEAQEYMTPRWAYAMQTLNHNIEKLNNLIYANQDYCVIAEVL